MKIFIKSLIFFVLVLIIGFVVSAKAQGQVRIDERGASGLGVTTCKIKGLNFGNVKQTFTPTEDYYLKNIELELRAKKLGQFTASSTMYMTIPGEGEVYGSVQIDSNSVLNTYSYIDFDFENQNIFLEQNKAYEIFFSMDSEVQPGELYARSYGNNYDLGGFYCQQSGYDGNKDLRFKAWGYPQVFNNWFFSTQIAQASSTCVFLHDGITTTSECSDPILTNTNPTLDIALGLFLFFVVFFGLIFRFK